MSEVITLVPTGLANLASVRAAFQRLGLMTALVSTPEQIEDASRVVMPGVGAYGPAMSELMRRGWADALRARIASDRPTLAICLGHQLLGQRSDEAPGVKGLSSIAASASAFESDVLSPQMGWNQVVPEPDCAVLTEGYAYFANSYRFKKIPEGWLGAQSVYGGEFVAALERGNVLSCQFHPELSGAYGSALLSRWLELTEASC